MGDKGSSGGDRMRTLTGLPVATLLPTTARPDAGPAEEPIELSDEVADSDTGGFQPAQTLTGAEKDDGIAGAVVRAIDYKERYEQERTARLDAEEARQKAEEDARAAEQTVTANAEGQKALMQQIKAYYTTQIEVLTITAANLRDQLDRYMPKKGRVIKVTPLEQQVNDAQARVSRLEQILREKFAQSEGQAAPQEGETPQGAGLAQAPPQTVDTMYADLVRRVEEKAEPLIKTGYLYQKLLKGTTPDDASKITTNLTQNRIMYEMLLGEVRAAAQKADERIRELNELTAKYADIQRQVQEVNERAAGIEQMLREVDAGKAEIAGRETRIRDEISRLDGEKAAIERRKTDVEEEVRKTKLQVMKDLQQEVGRVGKYYRWLKTNLSPFMNATYDRFLSYERRVRDIKDKKGCEYVALLLSSEFTSRLVPATEQGDITAGVTREKLDEIKDLVGRLVTPKKSVIITGKDPKLGLYAIQPAIDTSGKIIAYFCMVGVEPDPRSGEMTMRKQEDLATTAERVTGDVLNDYALLRNLSEVEFANMLEGVEQLQERVLSILKL
jgi:hypothetical protein